MDRVSNGFSMPRLTALLPGPETQQQPAIYVGWLLNGARGSLFAGVLFVLPGFVALLGLTTIYLAAGDSTLVTALAVGCRPSPRGVHVGAGVQR